MGGSIEHAVAAAQQPVRLGADELQGGGTALDELEAQLLARQDFLVGLRDDGLVDERVAAAVEPHRRCHAGVQPRLRQIWRRAVRERVGYFAWREE